MAKLKVSMSLLLTVLLVVSVFAMGCPPPPPPVVEPPVVEPVVIEPPPPPVRYGAWVDEIIATRVPDHAKAVTMIEVGELDLFTWPVGLDLYRRVVEHPGVDYERAFGSFNELTFNPVGPVFPGTGKLNPFAVPRMREAMNWLIDRDHIVEEIMGGMAVPRYTVLHPAFPDYTRVIDVARRLEIYYAHNPAKAKAIITEEMKKLGAELIGGVWHWEGKPVEIIMLSRIEDARLHIGRYVGSLLEELGFVMIYLEKTAGEASPIWLLGDPAAGLMHIYTGGWIATVIDRDQGDVFNFFYTPRGMPRPLWLALKPAPEFDELADRLAKGDFTTVEERAEMMARALELSLEDSHRVWVSNLISVIPRRADMRVVADLAGGISGAFLWGLTSHFVDPVTGKPIEGGALRVATTELLPEPWNPIAGSNWIFDLQFIRVTSDWGTVWDPFTGLHHPQRIERAEIYVKEGLPVGITHDWLTLEFVPKIEVPADAWVDWDAVEQRFITRAEKYPEGLTARLRSVVHYPGDLFDTVKWHDGSPLSLADFIMRMILEFDRAKEASPVFDKAAVPPFTTFMGHFRGMRILSEDPLVIESFTDMAFLDAEWNAWTWTWFPFYLQGPGAWHNLSLGLFAEAAKELAFSAPKSRELKEEWTNYIAGPSIPILRGHLERALAGGLFPYEPTLGQFLTAAEVAERWRNLQAWYGAKGHFWLGTGPFYLERAYPVEKIVHLKRFPYFPDPAEKWLGFAEPMLAEVEVLGPAEVRIGREATFDIKVTFKGEPYPVAEVDFVTFLVLDAHGKIVHVGEAKAVADGLWRAVLTAEMTGKLVVGGSRLEVAVAPLAVALPTFGALGFIALP